VTPLYLILPVFLSLFQAFSNSLLIFQLEAKYKFAGAKAENFQGMNLCDGDIINEITNIRNVIRMCPEACYRAGLS
jgi:hypothetical protein